MVARPIIKTRAREDIELFRNFMFDEHIINLEQMITSYKKSIEQGDVPVNLTKRQTDILEKMRLYPSITATELAVKFGVSDKTIKRDISSLKSEGYIARVGSDKKVNGKYSHPIFKKSQLVKIGFYTILDRYIFSF